MLHFESFETFQKKHLHYLYYSVIIGLADKENGNSASGSESAGDEKPPPQTQSHNRNGNATTEH